MSQGWIQQARRDVQNFFATATEEEIRRIADECGFDVYEKGPSQKIVEFDFPRQARREVYLIVGSMNVDSYYRPPEKNYAVFTARPVSTYSK